MQCNIPRWPTDVEIPQESVVLVGHTVSIWRNTSKARDQVSFNVIFLVVLAVPDADLV